jgi:uncharacterized protein (TIGR02246 family)
MRPLIAFTILLSAAAMSACARRPDASATSSADSAAIDSLYQAFRRGYAALDAPMVGDLYREDALYAYGGGPGFMLGRDSITHGFAKFFRVVAADSAHLELRFRFVRRFRRDDLASDAGFYWLRRVKGDSAGKASVGKFVTVMQRDSTGRWRFALDSYSDGSLAAFDSAPPWVP